ncbi:putative cytochrome P450 oxygenase [Trichoderma velutinum]
MSGTFDWKLKSFHEKYGEVVRYSPEELSFTSEQAWRDIYAHKPAPLIKDPMIYNAVKLGADGAFSIFNADEVQHARIRKQLSHAFSEKALRDQEPTLKSYVNLLIQKLHGIASSGQPTDMVRWLNYTTFDLIGDLAIGTSFGCLRDSQYHSWVRNLQEGTKIGPYIRTIATYTDFERIWRLFAPKSIKQARQRHEEYVRLNAEERLSRGVLAERKDFLSYILGTGDKDALTDKEVAANAGFLIIAGSEAAATAMSGILFHLLKSPESLRLVTKEIRESFNDEAEIDFMTTAARLPYLMACINEGMRSYPPGPTIPPRRTPRGQYTTIAGYEIPSWTSVGVHPLSTTHSPANFHLPDEFIPERWLPSAINDSSSPYYNDKRESVQPFSVGSRACLGKGLAYNEMRVILARLIWNFDVVLCEEAKEWDQQKSYTLWEKRQLLCTLRDIRSTEQN